MNSNFGWFTDPRLECSPITLYVEDSKVINFETTNQPMKLVLDLFFAIPYSRFIGEVGIGTNPGCVDFLPFISHFNERHPGLHLGLGAHNQSSKLVKWSSPIHLDLIAAKSDIWADKHCIMREGKFESVKQKVFNGIKTRISLTDTV